MTVLGSLQGRLALTIGLGVTALWIAAAVFTAATLRHEMAEVFDSALQETAQRILPLAVIDIIDREEEGVSQRVASLRPHEEFFTYLVRDNHGRVLLRSHNAEDAVFPRFEDVGFQQTETHRLYFDSALRGSITIAIAEPLAHRDKVARETLMALAVPLFVLVPLSLAVILLIVRRTLAPVRQFSAALATRGGGDLSPIRNGHLPSEITPVAGAVNQLLGRLQRTLDAERSFAANAAHELRTPVAAALAQTQRLIAETSDPGTGQRADDIEASLKRLNRLSEKLLQLARAEGGRMRTGVEQDIRPLMDMVVSDFTGSAGAGRVGYDSPGAAVLSDIDPDALAILARNLIENALKHGPQDQPVQVILSPEGVLRVINAGPPVAAETLKSLTARFERGQTASQGSGLGLSIAQAIADNAHGRLELLSPAPARKDGFEAVFYLPAASV